MNIIEKLEALIKFHSWAHEHANGDIENLVSVDDLRAIIDELKSTQAPDTFSINIKVPTKYRESTPITHPQLSDETVKDAAIGKLIREKMVSGNYVPVSRCIITKEEFDEVQ